MKMPRTPKNVALTPHGGANAASRAHIRGQCPVCLRRFTLKQGHQAFCSPRCRAMSWWAREIAEAIGQGKADGLRLPKGGL